MLCTAVPPVLWAGAEGAGPPEGLLAADTGPACSEVHPLPSLHLRFQTQGNPWSSQKLLSIVCCRSSKGHWEKGWGGLWGGKSLTGAREQGGLTRVALPVPTWVGGGLEGTGGGPVDGGLWMKG